MFLTTSADIVETFGSEDAPEKYLVALGCASWRAGQLEQEIADNAWLVAPASDTILFETIYEDRYSAANQLLGLILIILSFHKWGTVNGHHGNCI